MKPFKKIFGFEFKKSSKEKQEKKNLKSPVVPPNEDGASTVESSAFVRTYIDLHGSIGSEFQLITAYRSMQLQAECDLAIDDIVNESIVVDENDSPIELDLRFMNISVSRRVRAFFSMCGSFFGLISFVLARLGVNLNEEIVAWSMTLGSGIAGAVILLLALMLLLKGVKPLMNEIDITFG